MNANFSPAAIGESYESNQEVAEALAHTQENFQRVNAVKDSLGLAVPQGEELSSMIDDMAATQTEAMMQRRDGANGDPIQITQGRHEISSAVSGNIRANLASRQIAVSEYGRITPDQTNGITQAVADRASSIIDKIPRVIENETKVTLKNAPNAESVDGWMHVKVLNTEGHQENTQEDMQVRELALNAVGLYHDDVDNREFTPSGTTSGGWNSNVKYVATEVPGLFYKESFHTPPRGSEAQPIRTGELTTIAPSEADSRSEQIAA